MLATAARARPAIACLDTHRPFWESAGIETAQAADAASAPIPGGPGRALIPLGAALCLLPAMTPALGLLFGLLLSLLLGNPYLARTRKATSNLLALAVVGLGAGMDLRVVARVGAHGILYTATGIAVALALASLLTRALRVERNTGILVGVGTAICGGSAIAAVVPVLQPKESEVSVALGIVFLLNAVALFVFPPIGRLAGLSDAQFGLWSALAIHDTSSVVGAAVAWGGGAVAIATTVKLARALWIVPLTFAIAAWHRRTKGSAGAGKPRRPWFIAGFVAAAALVTYVPDLQGAGHRVSVVAKQLLVVTLFLVGANLTRDAVKAVGPRPLALGLLLWISTAALSLAAIATRLIS